ncbi:MAG: DUF58 domain-containing protein, partial [Chloroflexi bacterium]|nr:DUF58 domain-containing protein [Chloroflexota bacterium]
LAVQTQIGWLYLFDAGVWAMVVVSVLLPWWSLKSLRVKAGFHVPQPSSRTGPKVGPGPGENETLQISVQVENGGLLPRGLVGLTVDCPFEEPSRRRRVFFLPALPGHSSVPVNWDAVCFRRGYYDSLAVQLECLAPFGLFRSRRRYRLDLGLTVYPAYFPLKAEALLGNGQPANGDTSRFPGDSFDYLGAREYRFGDQLRRVHWQSTARRGQLVVKEYGRRASGVVQVAFETAHNCGAGKESTLEYSIKIAASIVAACEAARIPLDLFAGRRSLKQPNEVQAMGYLARLDAGGPDDFAGLGDGEPRVSIGIVWRRNSALVPVLRGLSRHSPVTFVVIEGFAGQEYTGLVEAGALGTGGGVIVCRPGGLGQAVRALEQAVQAARGS